MTKAYVIVAGDGAYSGRSTRPVRVYLDKDKAQEMMVKLDALYKLQERDEKRMAKEFPIRWTFGLKDDDPKVVQANANRAKREEWKANVRKWYESLGFDVSYDTDWELCEAELDQ